MLVAKAVDSSRTQQLHEIETLSQALLSACNNEEWDALTDIGNKREHLIRQFFETKPTADESEYIAATIHKVQSIDQQVISLCQAQKQEIAKKLSGMSKGKSVQASYQQITST